MSVQVQLRRDVASNVAGFTPAAGEAVVDLTNGRICVGDGHTVGGHPAAKLSESVLNTASSNVLATGSNGSSVTINIVEQEVSGFNGANVTAPSQILAGSLVLAVSARVLIPITGATAYQIGYPGNLTAFGSGLDVTVGATNEGMIGPNPFYTATPIIVTAIGGNFTGGGVRLAITYLSFTAPMA